MELRLSSTPLQQQPGQVAASSQFGQQQIRHQGEVVIQEGQTRNGQWASRVETPAVAVQRFATPSTNQGEVLNQNHMLQTPLINFPSPARALFQHQNHGILCHTDVHLGNFKQFACDPQELFKKLMLHTGEGSFSAEAHKIEQLVQRGFKAIEQKSNELKERKRILLEDQHKVMHAQELERKVKATIMPYFYSMMNDEDATFPYNVNNELVQLWLDHRIPNDSKLRSATMEGLRNLFGLEDYNELNNLSQKHLIMVLRMLKNITSTKKKLSKGTWRIW